MPLLPQGYSVLLPVFARCYCAHLAANPAGNPLEDMARWDTPAQHHHLAAVEAGITDCTYRQFLRAWAFFGLDAEEWCRPVRAVLKDAIAHSKGVRPGEADRDYIRRFHVLEHGRDRRSTIALAAIYRSITDMKHTIRKEANARAIDRSGTTRRLVVHRPRPFDPEVRTWEEPAVECESLPPLRRLR